MTWQGPAGARQVSFMHQTRANVNCSFARLQPAKTLTPDHHRRSLVLAAIAAESRIPTSVKTQRGKTSPPNTRVVFQALVSSPSALFLFLMEGVQRANAKTILSVKRKQTNSEIEHSLESSPLHTNPGPTAFVLVIGRAARVGAFQASANS